MFTLIN